MGWDEPIRLNRIEFPPQTKCWEGGKRSGAGKLNIKKMKDIAFQSVFDTPAQKIGTLNSLGMTPDGRIWTYLQATEAFSAYMVGSRPAVLGEDTVSSADQGGKTVLIQGGGSDNTWTAGAYIDHWVIVDSGTGVGQIGKIKANSATELTLYDEYEMATDLDVSDSDITIIHQPDAEKIAITNEYTHVQGVAQVAFAASDYGWFLIRGTGGVLMGEAASQDRGVCPGDNTEGTAVVVDDGDDLYDIFYIGHCIYPSDTADKAALVDIAIM